ncbi:MULTISPECIES: hypothetical protein [Halorussus]|uniref:hypothetical protein n=1 Tax=Halorussus TaxID=1070314 RepID=UPI00209CD9D4|nr:hypothetical protein [Halorussus vallis]USZ77865.1 hypothetical protein NGM07_22040 [Halorussus vallis]
MRPSLSRRAVLRAAALPLALGLAGCTDEAPEDVESVRVTNWHADPHTVAVAVRVDGTERLARTVDVPAVTECDGATDPGDATIEKTLPGPGYFGKRRYEVTARLDGGPPKTEATTTGDGFDGIEVRIGDDRSLDVVFADAV